ncbi:Glycerophosphodiester phosphodiesterase GDPDL5 [Cardamine amara subsp. amara]|uniref:glycerophosphodiester phosphodiesterase n=1 Tax=Cardamine amara subsp. amara TaxID=228776 RepID=A0ABD0ZTV2_CARAN
MACSRMVFLILIKFFIFHTALSSSWQTLSGKPPAVIARGGFSGMFPDSSSKAYELVASTTSPNVKLWCDLQLTKDGVGICFPNLNLDNGSDVMNLYPKKKSRLSVDFTWRELYDVKLVQSIFSRTPIFDVNFSILTFEQVANIATSGLWLNIQHSEFYTQHNLSTRNFVVSISRRVKVNFISSPEITFLKNIKKDVKPTVTKLIFRFLKQDQIDPFTNQSYGSLAKNLSYIRTFSSGILVPKSYIWPISSDLYLQPHTSLVTDAHKEGLQVFASEFANDFMIAYNYSYDPTAEYLSFVDNGNFSVDGFLSDFPITPFRAINCFSHLNPKKAKEQAKVTIISKDGASGDFPGCTDLAYEKAARDGVDILDCNVQISKDKIPFCLSSINLMNSTNVIETSFRNLSSLASEIQQQSGIYTFSLTMSQIQTLKPAISNPNRRYTLFRNPRNRNAGKILTLSEFLFLPNRYSSLSGILIKVENAAYLAEHQGLSVVDAVLDELKKATTQQNQTSAKTILIQSTDKSVLMKFKEKKQMNHDELVYRVVEDIRGVTDSAIKDIKNFAGSIVISKKSVFPYDNGFAKLETQKDVVARLNSSGLRVYVETFSNEFVSQECDFFSDPTVEIDSFVRDIKIDGIITDFPATTARYRKNKCYTKMGLIQPGVLLTFGNAIPPAAAPYPLLNESDVVEPPLPEVTSHPPTSVASHPPMSRPVKAEAKAIEVPFVFITMAILVSVFTLV